MTIEFDSLGGRFNDAAQVIEASWLENKDQTLDYNPDFLRSCYEYPGTDPELSPAIYEQGQLAAFVCGFPRTVRIHGRLRRLLMMTYFTVAPAAKGRGLGKRVWAECLRRARAKNYDGAIHYCVDGNKSNLVTVGAAELLGLSCVRIFTIQYLMRPVPEGASLGADSNASVALSIPEFEDAFARHAPAETSTLELGREWTRPEIEWQCRGRYGAVRETCDRGEAMLTAYVLKTAKPSRSPMLFIEDIFWSKIGLDQRIHMLNRLLARMAGAAEIALAPLWGYADMQAFRRAGFRLSTRKLHAYLTFWNGADAKIPEAPLYIDVF